MVTVRAGAPGSRRHQGGVHMTEQIRETLRRASWDTAAVPLRRLMTELRAGGSAVTAENLQRELARAGSAGRILGPLTLRSEVACDDPGSDPAVGGFAGGLHVRWVVFAPDGDDHPDPGAPPAARLRSTLLFLGRILDDRSSGDLARWLALVEEGNRYRDAA